MLAWLVGSSKPQKVRRHDAMASGQKHRDHLAIEIGPSRLAMQAEISLHVVRRLRWSLVDGVDAQALVSFQIVEVRRQKAYPGNCANRSSGVRNASMSAVMSACLRPEAA